MENNEYKWDDIRYLLVSENGTVYVSETVPKDDNRFVSESGQVHVAQAIIAAFPEDYYYRFVLKCKCVDEFPKVKHCFWGFEEGYQDELAR